MSEANSNRSGSTGAMGGDEQTGKQEIEASQRPQSVSDSILGSRSSVVGASNLPDWTVNSILGQHLWSDITNSGETCYVNEGDCHKSGPKRKCSACRITCHVKCIEALQTPCRSTYREADVRDYRDERASELQYGCIFGGLMEQETQFISHHWVNRRRQESKCKRCTKSLQTVFSFSSKEAIAVQCTWCKACYHNRLSCFDDTVRNEPCNLGTHSALIVPPSWIIKMPEKNTFKSSIRRTSSLNSRPSHLKPMNRQLPSSVSRPEGLTAAAEGMVTDSGSFHVQHLSDGRCLPGVNAVDLRMTPNLPFVIKANPSSAARIKPLLIFLNPKSGGNQGSALLRKFQWLLNPRQVFDLTQGGPRMGLELFNRVPNLRVLACGGDGTVGWLLSVIDEMRMSPTPPVAVLPLGTGNDLARTLRWGPGYADEPISKVLKNVENGEVVSLDRWRVHSELLPNVASPCDGETEDGGVHQRHVSETLPLKVFNNYFSLGADAATALEFHESREANPEKFNSRLKNKIFYAGCGGKDLLLRSWRDLCDHITLTCDEKDYTPLIRSLRPHVILFLNIPRYGSGTLPWGQPSSAGGFEPQRFDDGLIEVIGLSSTTLALIQVGGHGDRICQCRTVKMTTDKIIPMQLDGEPCRLLPSKIEISCSHQSLVVQKYGRQTATSLPYKKRRRRLRAKFCFGS
ncbi:unnamed protein product [Calicophoron daubneyi]|uniref:Diacylglycerol kinase n=1 Tax=Calicophoron daubneyi TaxID=300641 RepID=A0AAV2TQY1_CALDB